MMPNFGRNDRLTTGQCFTFLIADMQDSQETPQRKLVSPIGAVVDFILATVFFLVFTFFVIPSHVPAENPVAVYALSAYTSFAIAGVFWIALMLFRVTFVDQRMRRHAQG